MNNYKNPNYMKEYYQLNKEKASLRKKANHKKYPWKQIFQNVKSRCENPKSKSFKDYGKRGIKCLITVDEIKYLWFRDKAYNLEKPSIDREDNDGNYEYDNCQFIEMELNRIKDNKVAVVQFNKDYQFIRMWESMKLASDSLNIRISGISNCCNGLYMTSGGYVWKYQ